MNNQELAISIIVSTYNMPQWLEKVLLGYENQTYKNFEIIIADDGSGKDTLALIDKYKNNSKLTIKHVWHEDQGFRKCKILNNAIVASSHDYLLFTDGDCIPRNDFVEIHAKKAQKGYFLSGGYFKLPRNISETIDREHIIEGKAFDISWLKSQGLKRTIKNWKLSSSGRLEDFLNFVTPANASWNGHNASGWKTDLLRVNGFNEEMAYGGEDRELGERLFNMGIKSKQLRYSAICIHLDHDRGYVKEEMILKNNEIRKNTRKNKTVFTPNGIVKDDYEQEK